MAIAIGVLPVLLFLAGLRLMDSFKLVERRDLARSLGAGTLAAGVSFALNALALAAGAEDTVLKRYLAPLVEELLKAVWIYVLLRRHRVGFLVDAGIHGFAVGTGFAVVENLWYAWALGAMPISLWLARGLGTAVLHGSTTAIVAILARDLGERRRKVAVGDLLPGLGIAVVVHSLHNHLLFNPLLAAAAILVLMPLLLVVVYERSERHTRDWLGVGLDRDVERLELILSGEERDSPIGEYMETLRNRFEGSVRADMLCLLRVHLELSIRAKGVLIARGAGVNLPPDPATRDALGELRHLERTIGPTGRLAMLPLLSTSSRDLWQICVLGK